MTHFLSVGESGSFPNDTLSLCSCPSCLLFGDIILGRQLAVKSPPEMPNDNFSLLSFEMYRKYCGFTLMDTKPPVC